MYQEISTPGLLQYNNPTRMPPSDRQYEEFSRCQQVITEAAGTTSAKTADNSINTRDDTLESILNTTTETVVKTETITTISEASFTLPIIAVETNEVLTTISAPAPVPVPVVHPQPEIVSKPPAQSVLRSSRRRQRVASNDSTTSDAPSVSSNIRSEHVYSYDDEDCNRAISVTKASSSFDVASSVAYYNEEEENQEGEHKTDEYKPDQTDSIIRPKEEDDDEELYNFVKDYTSSAFSSFQTPFLHRSDSNSTDQHNDAGQQDAYEDSILDRAFSAAMRSLEANNATDSQSQDNVHESETISKQQRRLQRQQAAQSSSQSSNYRRMKASSGAPVSTAVTPPAATLFTHQTTVQSATATATTTSNSKTTMSTPALSIIPPLYDDWQMPPRVHESTAGQLPVFDPPPLAPVINTGLATDQVPVNFSPFTDRKLTTVPATEFSDNGPVPRSASIDTSLPTGWEQVSTPEGAIYYYHVETRVSRWTRPDDSVAEAINSRLTEEKMKTDEVILVMK